MLFIRGWLLHLGSWPRLYRSFPPPNGWYLPVRTFTKICFNRKGMDLCKRKSERFWSENGRRRRSWFNGDEREWLGGSEFGTKAEPLREMKKTKKTKNKTKDSYVFFSFCEAVGFQKKKKIFFSKIIKCLKLFY